MKRNRGFALLLRSALCGSVSIGSPSASGPSTLFQGREKGKKGMDALVLAAGFGTRLNPRGCCKPLLPVAKDRVVLDLVCESLLVPEISTIHVVHNRRWSNLFRKWKNDLHTDNGERLPRIRLHSTGIDAPHRALGAVADLRWAIEKIGIENPFLFLCGDTVLTYRVDQFIASANYLDVTIVVRNPILGEDVSQLGNVDVNDEGQVENFYEKKVIGSLPVWTGPAIFPSNTNGLIETYLEENPRSGDNLGRFISWLLIHFRHEHDSRMVRVWRTEKPSYDVGIPGNLLMLQQSLKKKEIVSR